ncbi:MAG: hypothetical protein C5B50_00775 [Verrucomicrobia bacterium]|nr:MAG: hypothetical protein C5B50_00775 [Verrucomicrobiota bacterium]
MPAFEMDYGNDEALKRFHALDSFTQGYIMAAFFTCTGTGDDEDLEDATFADLHPDSLAAAISDCKEFQEQQAEWLEMACHFDGYDDECAGRDFWYTRNHHGTGFWDRDIGNYSRILTDAAHCWGERGMYRGDNGLIHIN